MKTSILHLLDRLRSSFWVIPASLVAFAVLGALVLVQIDYEHSGWILEMAPWLKDISPDGTASLLGTVATSVLTLAGVTFSTTIVALTLASSQFGPRLLRNFIRSRANQITLGTLLATHAYCLVVLRNVRVGDSAFVPHLATFGAFLWSLVSLGYFIYFIHHVVTSIQAEHVVSEVYHELSESIERFFGQDDMEDHDEERENESERETWKELEDEHLLTSKDAGYLQAIAIEGLVDLAQANDMRCRVMVKPGQFIVQGKALLAVDKVNNLNDEATASLRDQFLLGTQATAEQDFEYCIRQLVEIALRALSPGVNDPFTAINCIDYLGAALVKVARKRLPENQFYDGDKVVRVKTEPESFASFLGAACHQIRQASADKPDVTISLLGMLHDVGEQCCSKEQQKAVLKQAEMVASVAKEAAPTSYDATVIEECFTEIMKLANYD